MANQRFSIESARHGHSHLWERVLSRRQLIKTAGSVGLVLGSGVGFPALAHDGRGRRRGEAQRCVSPLPIPHVTTPPGAHFFFPGPVTGVDFPTTDPTGAHPGGRDPSTITNFKGFIGQVDLDFSGTGTNTRTGETATFNFHTDTRFMKGKFIGSDERRHRGAFAFI